MDSKIDRFLFWDVLSSVDCRTSMASRATLACINVSHCENIHSICFQSLFLYVFALLILSQCLIKVTSDVHIIGRISEGNSSVLCQG